MRYLNDKTGAVIETVCHLSGGDWRALPAMPPKAAQKKPTPKKEAQVKTDG